MMSATVVLKLETVDETMRLVKTVSKHEEIFENNTSSHQLPFCEDENENCVRL